MPQPFNIRNSSVRLFKLFETVRLFRFYCGRGYSDFHVVGIARGKRGNGMLRNLKTIILSVFFDVVGNDFVRRIFLYRRIEIRVIDEIPIVLRKRVYRSIIGKFSGVLNG